MRTKLLAFSFLFSIGIQAQTTWTVDNNPANGANFTNAQTAMSAASEGDTLYIHPSAISYGLLNIDKTIHLRGLGHHPSVSNQQGAVFTNINLNAAFGATNVSIAGIVFQDLQVLNTQNYSNLVIENCELRSVTGNTSTPGTCDNWVLVGNVIGGMTFDLVRKNNQQNWLVANNHFYQPNTGITWPILRGFNGTDVVKNNIFVGNYGNGNATFFHECNNLTLQNCLLLLTGGATGFNNTSSTILYNHCLTYSYPGNTIQTLSGTNMLNNTNPQFTDISGSPVFAFNKDFQLLPASPAAGYGTDGQDLGLYGNSYNFNMRGYPSDLPYPTFMEITNSVVAPGGTLNVIFQANGN